MPLDPPIQFMLQAYEALNAPPMSAGTPEVARAAFRMLTVDLRQPEWIVPVGSVSEISIPGPDGPMASRVYRPEQLGTLATVLFFHGGGFVIGDLETHDNQARTICRDTKSVVVSVDYRLAPEAPWPAAVDDALAAAEWVFDNVADLGGAISRIGVAGDSAGGNLASVTAQACRDAGLNLKAQMLIYPAVDFAQDDVDYPSREEFAEGYFLTVEEMLWFGAHYAGVGADVSDPRLSPIKGKLAGLPPAVVITGEYDPLRDEGEAYAAALAKAGVETVQLRFDGLIHGFFDLAPISPASAAAVKSSCASFAGLLD